MLETILGGLVGGISRLAPEALSFFDKKNERKHELDMLDKQVAVDSTRSKNELTLEQTKESANQFTAALEALKESVKGQAATIGVKWVDAINALVRPSITYVVFSMWTLVKLYTLYATFVSHPNLAALAQALPVWWGESDQAMLSYILNFWFMGRVFDKALK